MKVRVGMALAIMLAIVLGQVRSNKPDRMRSLVGTAHPAENPQDHNQCPEQWRVPGNRSVWHKHKTP